MGGKGSDTTPKRQPKAQGATRAGKGEQAIPRSHLSLMLPHSKLSRRPGGSTLRSSPYLSCDEVTCWCEASAFSHL